MIEQLIDLFDAAVTAPVATKHGLAILGPDGPMRRTQAGQYTPIAVDNDAPWSYWRIGDIRSTPYDIYACSMGALQQVPLRLVMLLPNDCGQRDILLAAGRAVTATTGAAKELLGASRVRVVGQRIAVDGVGQAEKISDIPLQWSLIAIDMDLEVIGTADCLVGCGEGPSVLCSVITTATNAEVVECLGDRINEICESGPSDPGYVQLYDDDSPTPNPIGTPVAIPAGTTVPVTAPDGVVTLWNTGGGVLDRTRVLSGGAVDLVAPDGGAVVIDSDGDPITTVPIPSGNLVSVPIADSEIILPNGTKVLLKATQPYTVPQTAALKFSFGAYDQGSDLWTVTADEAGTYNVYTQDGSSGTITYSKNGGAFTALSGTITLAIGDTIQVKRTTITAAGWSRWQRLVIP